MHSILHVVTDGSWIQRFYCVDLYTYTVYTSKVIIIIYNNLTYLCIIYHNIITYLSNILKSSLKTQTLIICNESAFAVSLKICNLNSGRNQFTQQLSSISFGN